MLGDGSAVISVSQVTRAAACKSTIILSPTYRKVELQIGNVVNTLEIFSVVDCLETAAQNSIVDRPLDLSHRNRQGNGDFVHNPLTLMFRKNIDDEEHALTVNDDLEFTSLQQISSGQTMEQSHGVGNMHVEHVRIVTRSVVATALSLKICGPCRGALQWFSNPLTEQQFQDFYFVWNAPVLKTALAVNITVLPSSF